MNYIWTSTESEFTQYKVIDGDTLDVVFKLPFDIRANKRIRLARVDAPEMRTKNQEQKAKALACRNYVQVRLDKAKEIKIVTHKAGKFGRYLADIFVDGTNLNSELIEKGYATKYKGGRNVKT